MTGTLKTLVDGYSTRVDNTHYNLAADINNLQSAVDKLAYHSFDADFSNEETLTGNKTLTESDMPIQVLNPNGANRNITLPVVGENNFPYMIYNSGTSGGYTLILKNSGGTTFGVVPQGQGAIVFSDETQWLFLKGPQVFTGRTTAPTVNDDVNDGYQPGDIWIDETNEIAYIMVDETAGAANWHQITTVSAQFMLSARGGWPSTTSGCATPQKVEFVTNDVDVFGAAFDSSTKEYMQWNHPLPSDYNGGTITAKFFWYAADASTNGVRWGLQGFALGNSDAIDRTWGTAQETTDNNQANGDLNITSSTSAITLANSPQAGDMVQWRAYRDPVHAGDTLAVDAVLLWIEITYSRKGT